MPEKTLYQKRQNEKLSDLSGLNIVGSQITRIIRNQYSNHLKNTAELQ